MAGPIGLRRDNKVPPLLSTIGGKPRSQKEEVAVDAPPVSSDDEEEDGNLSSDGTVEEPAALSIRPTQFTSLKNTNLPSKATRAVTKRRKVDSSPRELKNDDGDEFLSSQASQASHLKNEYNFTKRQKTVGQYGAGNRSTKRRNETNSTLKMNVPALMESPERVSSFKAPLHDSFLDSPSRGSIGRFKSLDTDDDAMDPSSSVGSYSARKPSRGPTSKKQTNIFMKSRRKPQKPEKEASPDSSPAERAVWIPPPDIDDGPIRGASERELNNDSGKEDQPPPDDDSDLEDIADIVGADEQVVSPSCPWCGEPVDASLLEEFSRGKRLNVRMQTKFCQKHRKKTALETWKSRRYPEIEWSRLEDRLAKHRAFLLAIVNGKPSHFRTRLADDISAGKARSLKKEGNLNPGYYGPRGFNAMSDYLVEEFGDLLKRRAVDDRVIAGRGSAAFIQAVLVAELGVQLIREDMDVSAEEARDIMEESKTIGEMVHEDV